MENLFEEIDILRVRDFIDSHYEVPFSGNYHMILNKIFNCDISAQKLTMRRKSDYKSRYSVDLTHVHVFTGSPGLRFRRIEVDNGNVNSFDQTGRPLDITYSIIQVNNIIDNRNLVLYKFNDEWYLLAWVRTSTTNLNQSRFFLIDSDDGLTQIESLVYRLTHEDIVNESINRERDHIRRPNVFTRIFNKLYSYFLLK
jgi:outer membrane receptor for Fe3+-dicitrate